ncbi:glycoside hydrolase family 55 protein (plasmid) [Sphingomonas sp. NY01]|uniref:glycosyl hydrolase family 28-related protein n=1 Tax=Sphingomonas sp. NY01 TaxID=2968057 RepID=UPI00315CAC30
MENPLTRRTVLSGASFAGISLSTSDILRANGMDQAVPIPQKENAFVETISVRQFGAIGDGQFHPLSSQFSDLDTAQKKYPDATALSESLDGAAIQAAIDQAARLGEALQLRWCVHIPAGRYRLSRSIRLPSNVSLIGDGIGVSIIDNQNTRLDAPLIVNANPEAVSMSLRDLSLHGGTHGVRINVRQYVDGYEFLRVGFQMQSDKNFECNRLLQIGSFTGCTFAKAPYGVFVAEWTTNMANFYDCRFEDHTRASLHLTAAEVVNFFGGRFESGVGSDGKAATIELTRAAAINFYGVYFEGTHPVLLRERESRNGVTFTGCHFTASSNGPYRFDSDGTVNFGTNDWGTASTGPARMALSGTNTGLVGPGRRYLLRTPVAWHIHSEQVSLEAGKSHPVAVLEHVGTGSGTACVTGTLHLSRMAQRVSGVVASTVSYRLIATLSGGKPIAVELKPMTADTTPLRVISSTADGNRTTLFASASDGLGGILRWAIEAQAIAASPENRIEIDIS